MVNPLSPSLSVRGWKFSDRPSLPLPALLVLTAPRDFWLVDFTDGHVAEVRPR